MAATFTHLAPPGRVAGALSGALTCAWRLDPAGRLIGRWSIVPATSRAAARPARAA